LDRVIFEYLPAFFNPSSLQGVGTLPSIVHPKAELSALQLFSHIKGNSPSSSSRLVLSKEPESLHGSPPAWGPSHHGSVIPSM